MTEVTGDALAQRQRTCSSTSSPLSTVLDGVTGLQANVTDDVVKIVLVRGLNLRMVAEQMRAEVIAPVQSGSRSKRSAKAEVETDAVQRCRRRHRR